MGVIESGIFKALESPVKFKKRKPRNLRLDAKRVVGGSTEVMVKITNFGKGSQHIKAHLKYITRMGDDLENERGELFKNKEAINDLFKDWIKDISNNKRHKNQRDTMHMVLSMPDSVDSVSVQNATRDFAKKVFGKNHEYVFVLHTNEPHPHCHLTVKCKGFDGKRLNPRKADLQEWREDFAETLRDHGVDAVASPRSSRGITKKAEKSVIRHIERGDETHKPRVSKVRALKVREIVDEIESEKLGVIAQKKPWEDAIVKKQKIIRNTWLYVADLLEKVKTIITFNGKEAFNERPDYRGTKQDSKGQRAAALYQSNIKRYRQRTSPGTVASMRNVSDFNVVQHQRRIEVLLLKDAPNLLGCKHTTAHNEMRWKGNSVDRNTNTDGPNRLTRSEENVKLAKDIKRFVSNMPKIDSERSKLKEVLTQKFTLKLNVEKEVHRDLER